MLRCRTMKGLMYRTNSATTFCGAWEIWKQEIVAKSKDSSSSKGKERESILLAPASLNGTVFILEPNEDVTWKVPTDAECIPLFESKTFSLLLERYKKDQIEFQLPYQDSIRFGIEVKDNNLILMYAKMSIYCKRVFINPRNGNRHSLAGAIENSPFYDLVIVSDAGKQFKAHKCIFHSVFPDVDFEVEPNPFNGLPDCLINILMRFVYSGILSNDDCVEELLELKSFCSKHQGMEVLRNVIVKCIERKTMKTQILALMTDCQTRFQRIATLINGKEDLDNDIDRTHLAEPSRLMYVLKEGCRELIIGAIMQLQMMYMYAIEAGHMTKAAKIDMIKEISKKAGEVNSALKSVLKVLYKHLDFLTDEELTTICQYGQDDITKFIGELNQLFDKSFKPVMSAVIVSAKEKYKKEKVKKAGSKVVWALKNVLHIKEISKICELEEKMSDSIAYVHQKSEDLTDVDDERKVEFLKQFIEEDLPVYIKGLNNTKFFTTDGHSKKYRSLRNGFKYLFNNVTSYVKWFLDIFVENEDCLKVLLTKIRNLVDREEFDKTLNDLLRLPKSNINNKHTGDLTNKEVYQNPLPVESLLPQCIANLYNSMEYADLEFVVRGTMDQGTSFQESTCDACEIIRAHSVVVCSRCAWFQRALSSGMKESLDRKFHIEETTPSLFRKFIKYMYFFDVDFSLINTGDMMELISIADRYENEDLKNACEKELEKNHISDESAIYILALAHNLGTNNLKKSVLSHIRSSPECCKSEDYMKLPQEIKKEVQEEINSTTNGQLRNSMHQLELDFGMGSEAVATDSDDSDSSSSSSLVEIDTMSSPEVSPQVDSRNRNSLNDCIHTLRSIINAPDDELIRLALAADNDSARALNFYFEGNT